MGEDPEEACRRPVQQGPEEEGDEGDSGFALNAVTGSILLVVLAILYGANVPLIKSIEDTSPLTVTSPEVLTLRFITASVLVIPWVWANLPKAFAVLRPAAELALWLWLGYFLQICGLEKTPASITAITTALCGATVQVLEFVVEGKPFSPVVIGSSAVNLAGLVLFVTAPGAKPESGMSLVERTLRFFPLLQGNPLPHEAFFQGIPGEALAIAGAIFFGVHVYRCNRILRDPRNEETEAGKDFELALAIVQCILVTIVCLFVGLVDSPYSLGVQVESVERLNPVLWLKIAACGVLCTGLPSVVELYAFKVVKPEIASLIYCTIPLWGAILGVLFLKDGFGPQSILGGILILVSSAVPSIYEELAKQRGGSSEGAVPDASGSKTDDSSIDTAKD